MAAPVGEGGGDEEEEEEEEEKGGAAAGTEGMVPLLDEPRALVLREWPRGHVYHDALKDEVLSHDGGNYRNGKPWWIHWRHLANRKSVYHTRNSTPSLVGADGRPCI